MTDHEITVRPNAFEGRCGGVIRAYEGVTADDLVERHPWLDKESAEELVRFAEKLRTGQIALDDAREGEA